MPLDELKPRITVPLRWWPALLTYYSQRVPGSGVPAYFRDAFTFLRKYCELVECRRIISRRVPEFGLQGRQNVYQSVKPRGFFLFRRGKNSYVPMMSSVLPVCWWNLPDREKSVCIPDGHTNRQSRDGDDDERPQRHLGRCCQ